MAEKLSKFDVADYLTDEASMGEYLTAILADGDPDLLLSAIGDIAKARGMTQIAERAGLGRESLYKAFAPGAKPRFETVMKVLQSLNINLSATAATTG